jgi:matrixin
MTYGFLRAEAASLAPARITTEGEMRLRVLFVVAALSALMVATVPAWAKPTAKLIKVDVFKQAGKPGPATANCSPDGTANGVYAVTGWAIGGDRTAHLNTATVPSGLGSVTATLQAAFDAWRVKTGVPKVTVAADGNVTRYTANRQYDLLWGRTGGSSIAVTYTWRWTDGLVESDTVFNAGLRWGQLPNDPDGCDLSKPVYDVGNIATHEFGHSYGLDHPAGDRFETMYAYGYTGETLKRSPANGDVSGVSSVY